MRKIAVIPARGGSKRLPGKNIMPLGGIPLIAHSIRYALANPNIVDEVFVTSDDPAILGVAIQFGAKAIERPASISGDHEPTVTAIQHVLSLEDADQVILLQPTNPLRQVNLLADAFEQYQKSARLSLFTVSESRHKLGRISDGNFVPFNYTPGQRSQDLEPLYFENGLLYISAADAIRNGQIITEDAVPFVVNHPFGGVDIDTQDDFDLAEWLLNKHHE